MERHTEHISERTRRQVARMINEVGASMELARDARRAPLSDAALDRLLNTLREVQP